MINEVRVKKAGVVGNLSTNPRRLRDGLIRVLELDLSHNEAGVVTVKFVHLPDQTFMFDPVSGFLNQGMLTERVQHCPSLFDWNFVLEFQSHGAI